MDQEYFDETLPLENSHYYELKLSSLAQRIKEGIRLADVILDLEQDLLKLLDSDVMTIYHVAPDKETLVSLYSTGSQVKEIRVKIDSNSIAGYVAKHRQALTINDVRDTTALSQIDRRLAWNEDVDRRSGFQTRNMLTVPIVDGDTLLGVLQVLNKQNLRDYSSGNLSALERVAEMLATHFPYDLRSTKGPYDALVEHNLITGRLLAELDMQARHFRVPLSLVLQERQGISAEDIGSALAQHYQVPFLPYVELYDPDPHVVERLGRDFLASNLWVPLTGDEGETIVLAADPNMRERIIDLLQLTSDLTYDVWVGLPEDILRYLGIEFKLPPELAEAGTTLGNLMDRMSEGPQLEVIEAVEEAPIENDSIIIPVVNCLIADAIEAGASDVHIQPNRGGRAANVRLRIDGDCRPGVEIPASHVRAVVNRVKIMSGIDISESRRPQDGKLYTRHQGQDRELRVATIPTVNGEAIILRILQSGMSYNFERLNFLDRNIPAIQHALGMPHGLLLVVGPTGSGKTTTMHGLLHQLNTPERNILTVEDPVEITQDGIQQVQVHRRIGMTFAAAARAFLRADPDVILIGEMRDQETAQVAVEASLTGHLVLSTLHTNSAAETVARVLLMGLDPLNLSDSLVAVVAQRLVRCVCVECREAYVASEEEVERLRHFYGEKWWPELGIEPGDTVELYRGAGCEVCSETGLRQRAAVHEVLACSPRIKTLIAHAAPAHELLDVAMEEGMRTLVQDCVVKVLAGQVSFAEIQRLSI